MKLLKFLLKKSIFILLLSGASYTPFVLPGAYRTGATTLGEALITVLPMPLYGKITFPAPEYEGGPQDVELPNKTFGGLSLTEGFARKVGDQITIINKVTFAGVVLYAECVTTVSAASVSLNFKVTPFPTQPVPVDAEGLPQMDMAKPKPVTILGITLEEANFRIGSLPGITPLLLQQNPGMTPWSLVIDGTFKLSGLVFNAGFRISPGTASSLGTFFATVAPIVNEWRPFADVTIPQLKSIVLKDLKASVKGGVGTTGFVGTISVSGTSIILNTKAMVSVDLGKQEAGVGLIAIARLPEGWKLSQSFPELFQSKNPMTEALDLLKISNAELILSTISGQVAIPAVVRPGSAAQAAAGNVAMETIFVEKGITLTSTVSLDEKSNNPVLKILNQVTKGVGTFSKEEAAGQAGLTMRGLIPPSVRNFRLQIGATAGNIAFNVGPAKFYGGSLDLIVKGEPSIGFGGSFKMIPSPKDKPLEFALEFEFGAIKFGLAGNMVGAWNKPFGIPGFQFGNLGIRGTQTYSAIQEAVAAAAGTAGVGALVALIPADVGMAGEVTFGTPPDTIHAGLKMNLGKDVSSLGFIGEVKTAYPLSRMVEILLKQMGAPIKIIDFVPLNLRNIKLFFVPVGTSIGRIRLEQGIGFSADADIFGKKASLDLGLDLTQGAKAKGTVEKFNIGPLKISGVNGQGDPLVHIELGANAQVFKISGQAVLGDLIKSNTDLLISPKGMEFTLESEFGPPGGKISTIVKGSTGPITNVIRPPAPGEVKMSIDFKNEFTEKLNESIIALITKSREDFEKDINDSIVQVVRNATTKDIEKQEAAVKYAQSRRVQCKDDLMLCMVREADVTKQQSALDALRVKYNFEQTDLGKLIRKIMDDLGISKALAKALKDIGTIGSAVSKQFQFNVEKIIKLVVVKKLSWKGDLTDLADGKIQGLDLEVSLSGQVVKRKIDDFNLKDPAKSVAALVDQVARIAIDAIKASVSGATIPKDMCASLQEHVEHWEKNGPKDEKGIRLDGDWWRGQFLLDACTKENPETAKKLKPRMLKGAGCRQLKQHVDYWAPKGVNGDPAASEKYWKECAAENIDEARKLMLQLPGAGCFEFTKHVNFWSPQGKDGDPGKGHLHYDQCKVENPKLAQELAAKLPGYPGGVFEAGQKAAGQKEACKELEKHIEFWNKNGTGFDEDKSGAGIKYLEKCKLGDPALAAQLAPKMLPGPNCKDLADHIKYWREHGGKEANPSDVIRGDDLLKVCQKEQPAKAAILQKQLMALRPAGAQKTAQPAATAQQAAAAAQQAAQICKEFQTHVDYWETMGRDGDPLKTVRLWSACAAVDIDLARKFMLRMPGAGCHELIKHIDYWSSHGGKDGDIPRGDMLIGQCRGEDPAKAAELWAQLSTLR